MDGLTQPFSWLCFFLRPLSTNKETSAQTYVGVKGVVEMLVKSMWYVELYYVISFEKDPKFKIKKYPSFQNSLNIVLPSFLGALVTLFGGHFL